MKNAKKFITILLCMMLVVASVVTVSAEQSNFKGIVSKSVNVLENGDVEVIIDLAGNPGITALSLSVKYDSNVLSLKDNGFVDTGLLRGPIGTDLDYNPFRLSWNDSNNSRVEINYSNGTIAKLYFKAAENFYGTTKIDVNVVLSQTIYDDEFIDGPAMESGVIYVTRDKFAIKDGVAISNGLNGETLIIASYSNDSMIDYKVYPNSTGNMKVTIADVINTNGATKVKAFLWKNFKNIVPVCESVESGF